MSAYIKLSTLEYPRHEGDIRLEYPEISEDQTGDTFRCPRTYARVYATKPPEYNFETQTLVEKAPENIRDVWIQVWEVRALTAEELQARADYIAKLKSE